MDERSSVITTGVQQKVDASANSHASLSERITRMEAMQAGMNWVHR
jgi:hypothetical protein